MATKMLSPRIDATTPSSSPPSSSSPSSPSSSLSQPRPQPISPLISGTTSLDEIRLGIETGSDQIGTSTAGRSSSFNSNHDNADGTVHALENLHINFTEEAGSDPKRYSSNDDVVPVVSASRSKVKKYRQDCNDKNKQNGKSSNSSNNSSIISSSNSSGCKAKSKGGTGTAVSMATTMSFDSTGCEEPRVVTSHQKAAKKYKMPREPIADRIEVEEDSNRKNSQNFSALTLTGRAEGKEEMTSSKEAEATWRLLGDAETLRRSKCRRVYGERGRASDLALFYRQGKFFSMSAWCSHMGGPLFEGDIEDYKGSLHVMCPWHAYMFDARTGMSDIGLKQDVFPVKVEDGKVFVLYDTCLSLFPYL